MSTSLKLRVAPRFLSAIFNGLGTAVRRDGLATYIDIDYSAFAPLVSFDPTAQQILAQSTIDGSFASTTISQILTSSQTQQIITSGTDVNVAASDGLIVINKTIESATTVYLPASTAKIGPVKIVDWKGDAGNYNITINVVGSDKLNGNLTSWTIEADGGSLVFTPLNDGSGYAV